MSVLDLLLVVAFSVLPFCLLLTDSNRGNLMMHAVSCTLLYKINKAFLERSRRYTSEANGNASMLATIIFSSHVSKVSLIVDKSGSVATELLAGIAFIYCFVTFWYPPNVFKKSWIWGLLIGALITFICFDNPLISLSLSLLFVVDCYYSRFILSEELCSQSHWSKLLAWIPFVISAGYVLYVTQGKIDLSKIGSPAQWAKELTMLFGTKYFLPNALRSVYSEINVDQNLIPRACLGIWAMLFVGDVMYIRVHNKKLSNTWRALNMLMLSCVLCGPFRRMFQSPLFVLVAKTSIYTHVPLALFSMAIASLVSDALVISADTSSGNVIILQHQRCIDYPLARVVLSLFGSKQPKDMVIKHHGSSSLSYLLISLLLWIAVLLCTIQTFLLTAAR